MRDLGEALAGVAVGIVVLLAVNTMAPGLSKDYWVDLIFGLAACWTVQIALEGRRSA